MNKKNKKIGSEMINFYKLKDVQKLMDHDADEQYEFTNCKIYKHLLIVGGTGAGKSNCLLNYIFLTGLPKKGTFDCILFCYETDEFLYEFLKEKLTPGTIVFIKGVSNFPDVEKFPDLIDQKEPKKYLVVFDDCLNEKNKANVKKIQDYFKLGRKRGITLAFLTQRYYSTDIFIRAQISYLFLAGQISSKDASCILKDTSLGDMDKTTLMKIFNFATKKETPDDMPFLKINKMVCPIGEKFSRNFTDFIDPSQFN